jgi:hypothetical protein
MEKLTGSGIWVLVAVIAAALPASCVNQKVSDQPPQRAQLAEAISTPERHDPPEPLSLVARALLKDRMASHARDMGELVSAIMLLEYPTSRSERTRSWLTWT